MRHAMPKVAIVFPADASELAATRVENTRLKGVAYALASAGAEVTSGPFCDEIASEIEGRLADVDFILVWFNPFEGGRDRSRLNAMLRALSSKGVRVSGHPDLIDKIGTKDVLYQTRHMSWGTDTRRYDSLDAMRAELPAALKVGPRVLKQLRGQSGDGVWKVSLKDPSMLAVYHAKRDSVGEIMPLNQFLEVCRPYFAQFGAMIDQQFQPRIAEGMIRCYVVGDRVAGFGEQLVNALYPAPAGKPEAEAPQPGLRLYFPADRAELQPLKRKLEGEWIGQLCEALHINRDELPALWDADFMYGEKSSSGEDSYVLCEINMSSVYPFPPTAMGPLVDEVLRRCADD